MQTAPHIRWSLSAICAVALAFSTCAPAQTITRADPQTTKKSAKKPVAKTAKHAAKKPVAPPVSEVAGGSAGPAQGERWQCELGNEFYLDGNLARDLILTTHWRGKNYQLPRVNTVTGAERYFDPASGMDLVIIPHKAMLFSRNQGIRLADECKTVAMAAGAVAPTNAELLRAPVIDPLMPQESMPANAPATTR